MATAVPPEFYESAKLAKFPFEPYWPSEKLRICITGAGGFIASHLAKRLKSEGHYILGCDWKRNEHMPVRAVCRSAVWSHGAFFWREWEPHAETPQPLGSCALPHQITRRASGCRAHLATSMLARRQPSNRLRCAAARFGARKYNSLSCALIVLQSRAVSALYLCLRSQGTLPCHPCSGVLTVSGPIRQARLLQIGLM